MRHSAVIFALFALFFSAAVSCQAAGEGVNEKIFRKVLSAVKGKDTLSTPELTLEIARQLLGTPYVAGTLEKEPEELRVYLDSTDCILFVELCSSFALTVKSGKPTYSLLKDNIREMRYRNGTVDGYASRIHYTSEWIARNEARGICAEITDTLGGIPLDQEFSYMTRHTDQYRQLDGNPEEVERIWGVEESLNQKGYSYIPQNAIAAADIRDGDIICFVSRVPGLDISHVAIACRADDGQMHFIHASSKAGEVTMEKRTLEEYASNGIRVVRLL